MIDQDRGEGGTALMEEWRDVPGYEGRYEVSTLGRVRSLMFRNKQAERVRATPLLLRLTLSNNGYPSVSLGKGGRKISRRVHTVVLLAFAGPRPEGAEGTHLDGVKTNNQLDNLAWRTKRDNEADKIRHGTKVAGTGQKAAKLNDDAVRAIRAAKGVESVSVLAKRYGVSVSVVYGVWKGVGWKHVA